MPVVLADVQGLRFADSASVWEQPIYWQATLGEWRAGIRAALEAHRGR